MISLKSGVFTLGMTILSLACNEKLYYLYNYKDYTIDLKKL
jgi:hypothetical protein